MPKAIIVGASRGIGRAIAIAMAQNGFDLILLARSEKDLRDVVSVCRKECKNSESSKQIEYRVVDVCNRQLHTQVLEESLIAFQGVLHVLIYCTGIQDAVHSAVNDQKSAKTIDDMFEANVLACMRSVAVCVPTLVQTSRSLNNVASDSSSTAATASSSASCSIVLISSLARYTIGVPGNGAYYATKNALHGYANCLQSELRHHFIKVSLVCPGLVQTELGEHLVGSLGFVSEKAMLNPVDVADATMLCVRARPTACITEITLEPAAPLLKTLELLVERPPVPQPSCRFAVSKPQRKVALITGGSRGIGKSVAIALAAEGYSLSLLARDIATLTETRSEIMGRFPGIAVYITALDVSSYELLENAVHNTVNEFGNLSVLVCNAAVNRRKSALTAKRDVWDQIVDINLKHAMHATRASLPYIHQSKSQGAVIYMSSEATQFEAGQVGLAPYYTTKYGLLGLAKCVFEDVRIFGIKVTVIGPGLTNTDLGTRRGPVDFLQTPPEHMIQGSDVSDAVLYVLHSHPRANPKRIFISPIMQSFPFVANAADELCSKQNVNLFTPLTSSQAPIRARL